MQTAHMGRRWPGSRRSGSLAAAMGSEAGGVAGLGGDGGGCLAVRESRVLEGDPFTEGFWMQKNGRSGGQFEL